MLKEELLELLMKLKRRKHKPYYTLNEIVRYIMYHDGETSVVTILKKLRDLEKQHFIGKRKRLKLKSEVWGFPIYETIFFIYDKTIERYLKYKEKTITLIG